MGQRNGKALSVHTDKGSVRSGKKEKCNIPGSALNCIFIQTYFSCCFKGLLGDDKGETKSD